MDGRLTAVVEAVDACAGVQPWGLDSAELVDALAAVHRVEQQLAAVMLALVREVHARGVATGEGASSTAVWLRQRLRMSTGTAGRLVRLAAALHDGPAVLRDSVAAGAVSVEQAAVISAAVDGLPAEVGAGVAGQATAVLVEQAGQFEPAILRRLGGRILTHLAPQLAEQTDRRAVEAAERRAEHDRFLTLTPDPYSAGVLLRGRLDTEAAATVAAALDPLTRPTPTPDGARDERSPGQRRADALTEVCRLALTCGDLPDNGGDRPQIIVTTTLDTLTQQIGPAHLDTGQPISATTARRLACDAAIIPAILNSTGQPLDLGRERRLITGPLRRALVLRDQGCTFPGCDRPARWCHAHHITHWADGGPTTLDNAALLCSHHHREIHKGHWQIQLSHDHQPEFLPPTWIDPTQTPRRNPYHRRQ